MLKSGVGFEGSPLTGVRHGATRHFIFSEWPTIVSRCSCSIWSRCLAHVINLATQALLAAHSPAKHYDPTKPTEHEPDVDRYLCDEIGLVWAIVVKVSTLCQTFFCLIVNFTLKAHSSEKCKEHLLNIQTCTGQKQALMLLMDMKVHWSSTFNMLAQALKLKEVCPDIFYHFP